MLTQKKQFPEISPDAGLTLMPTNLLPPTEQQSLSEESKGCTLVVVVYFYSSALLNQNHRILTNWPGRMLASFETSQTISASSAVISMSYPLTLAKELTELSTFHGFSHSEIQSPSKILSKIHGHVCHSNGPTILK